MADIAWIRKYRPSSFDDYMGDDVKRLVINRFKDKNNIPNTIMLYGTRGTGKTSMARLLSKEIQCLSPVDGHSCGQCEMCEAIDEYITSTEAGIECPGIIEVDAATTTGKNDINEIIEDVLIPPMYPVQYKVVILDECHMLSKSAQNSLLKVIEEPPKHLVFILCTTDPDDVIPTIHSRMQLKLEVRRKTVDEMAQKLLQIAEQEKLTTSLEALRIIAKKGDRIPRECINLLESVAKNYGGEVSVENVRLALKDISTELYLKYYESANDSFEQILSFNKLLKDKDVPADKFVTGLIRFTLDAMYIKHGISLDDFPVELVAKVKKLFDIYNSSDFDVLLQIMEQMARSIGPDDTKNELIITNTAMRISKVNLIAHGLAMQNDVARSENIVSIENYKQKAAEANKDAIEKLPESDIRKEEFAALFSGMEDVTGGQEVLDHSASLQTDKSDDRTQRIMDIFNNMDN